MDSPYRPELERELLRVVLNPKHVGADWVRHIEVVVRCPVTWSEAILDDRIVVLNMTEEPGAEDVYTVDQRRRAEELYARMLELVKARRLAC